MRNSVVRALLGIAVALVAGNATAKVSKAQDKNTKSKTAVVQSHENKKPKLSADEAARRARLKKIGSATPKETPTTNGKRPKQEAHPGAPAAKSKASAKPATGIAPSAANRPHPESRNNQVASNADGSSVAERRARIHNMRVPE